MSRRARRRGKESVGGGRWLKVTVALLLVMVVSVGVLHMMIRRHLQSEAFRIFISDKVSEAINVQGEFKPLKWDGLAVQSDGFKAEGNEQIRVVDIKGVKTDIGLGGFWRGVWEVEGFSIREVDLEIDARTGTPPAFKLEKKRKKDGWLPNEVEMQNMRIAHLSVKALLDSGPADLKGVRVDAQPTSGNQAYDVRLLGGKLTLPDERIPTINLDSADLKTKNGAVFINDVQARFWEQGRLEMTGQWDPSLEIKAAQGYVSGVSCNELVSGEWERRLRGDLSTDFNVVWVDNKPHANGTLVMQNGVLTSHPTLEMLEAYLSITRFRMLNFSEARTDWKWREGRWSISNLVIVSEGLLRVEGNMKVVGENIDGHFNLGLAPGTLARIPGAEKHVFTERRNGFVWAPVHVTGTLSDPKHDLTDRLFEAAGRRMLEALPEAAVEAILLGKGIIDVSTQNALQEGIKLFGGEAGQGIDEVIRQGAEGAVEGVLKGIFGGGL